MSTGQFSRRARFAIPRLVVSTYSAMAILALAPRHALADPPPPPPSQTSVVGMDVTNPSTGLVTKVDALILDPAGTPTANDVAFVRTADGYVFLVKPVGQSFYVVNDPSNAQSDLTQFKVLSADTTAHTVQIEHTKAGTPPVVDTTTLGSWLTAQQYSDAFPTMDNISVPDTPPDIRSGANGVQYVTHGGNGSNGHIGVFFVPPSSGGPGGTGLPNDYTLVDANPDPAVVNPDINTSANIGLEIGSVGGNGGTGGSAYLDVWSARPGGNAGSGGTVTVTVPARLANQEPIQIATTGDDHHGIFAYSRSGTAGRGGDSVLAVGDAGSGGHAANGGDVTVTNNGSVTTDGARAFGIYGLSVSANAGSGGNSFGFVGNGGNGGWSGSGGNVTITNNGVIHTGGDLVHPTGTGSHGILAQSIGGTGGDAGSTIALIVDNNSATSDGGKGGEVKVTNNGTITTTAAMSRGIFAMSVGGGGGSAGESWGLIALGGSGSFGGNAGKTSVFNNLGASITTYGRDSDGIFAQSVGGSGGSAADSGGAHRHRRYRRQGR